MKTNLCLIGDDSIQGVLSRSVRSSVVFHVLKFYTITLKTNQAFLI